jgi:hypothetical protein
MTDPIGPINASGGLRGAAKRSQQLALSRESADHDDEPANLPAIIETPEEPAPAPRRLNFATIAAQIISGGQKRGLRGGRDTLDRARSTYLETEWSGPNDRRIPTGRITKTDV